MDILLYLLELLQQRKEVGITGLGTFYKKKFPGRYDKEKQSFLPPAYTLQFSSDVREEDALANFISSKRNISAESAQYYISKFAEEVNQKLAVENEAELENTGRLFFTEHEGLSFEPSKNINYGSEFYGLPAVNETVTEDSSPTEDPKTEEEEVFDEIAEAPTSSDLKTEETTEAALPVIENIELDEVKDDLKNTLKHTDNPVTDVHPAPEFIVEQHTEHPNRFGHTPESEEPKKYLHLNQEDVEHEEIIDVPESVKEQHAEHPNRFGHDPLADRPESETGKSLWTKIFIGILILLAIGVILYFIKPELFNQQNTVETKAIPLVDSPKTVVDSAKIKQDSIAKTDSIKKANLVQQNTLDSVKKKVVKTEVTTPKTEIATNAENITFDVIAYASKDKKAADNYIAIMKKNGYDAKIANMPGPWKKVSIANFKTQKEAENQKDILQKKLKGKGFYVQQINNNTL